MILSKGNLQVVLVSQDDKNIPGLNNVLIEKNGCTVAVNRNSVIIVGAIDKKVCENVPLEPSYNDIDVVISSDTIKEIIKNIPRDTLFNGLLEHCDMDKKGLFTITDGKRKKKISGKINDKPFVNYRSLVECGDVTYKTALNFKRLHTLLNTMQKVCGDSTGESVVFMEFTEDNKLILRAKNMKNKQEMFIITTCYKNSSRNEQNFLLPITVKKTKVKKKRYKKLKK